MDTREFREQGHVLVDWMADYLENIRDLPVKSPVQPGDITTALPPDAPAEGEPFDKIFEDFRNLIVPGMTHWQHPSFFAYFPANSSPPSVLAEMLTATLGAQCMSWQTSPAATELEERVMQWLRKMIGLPETFTGVLQDTASTATLCALLTAREHRTDFGINEHGFADAPIFTVYCSTETHSSIEKDVKIAGIGREHLRRVAVDDSFAMRPEALQEAIERDVADGYTPLCVIATLGTTSSTAMDPIRPVAEICCKHAVWLHVDAAFAGTALLLPEMRDMIDGIETADSFVFNPHKWMFTNFDCSAYFVRDVEALVRTFEILPEYLKTKEGDRVNNYRDWGVQLGRRFRALKLWFVIRTYGVAGLQALIRKHLGIARDLVERIRAAGDFEILAPVPLNVVCFRYRPEDVDEASLDEINQRLLEAVNATGRMYITHTKLDGKFTLRMVTAQTRVEKEDVENAWDLLQTTARGLKP